MNKQMTYADVLSLLDADTLADMIYDDRDSGGPARNLSQMVYDFARDMNIEIVEKKE
jgi:hypothetical protein